MLNIKQNKEPRAAHRLTGNAQLERLTEVWREKKKKKSCDDVIEILRERASKRRCVTRKLKEESEETETHTDAKQSCNYGTFVTSSLADLNNLPSLIASSKSFRVLYFSFSLTHLTCCYTLVH